MMVNEILFKNHFFLSSNIILVIEESIDHKDFSDIQTTKLSSNNSTDTE